MFIALAKIPVHEGSISTSNLYGSGVDQGNEEGRASFLLLTSGFVGSGEYLLMVKPMVVGFCSTEVDTTLDLRTLPQFQGNEMRTPRQSKISSFSFMFAINRKN